MKIKLRKNNNKKKHIIYRIKFSNYNNNQRDKTNFNKITLNKELNTYKT